MIGETNKIINSVLLTQFETQNIILSDIVIITLYILTFIVAEIFLIKWLNSDNGDTEFGLFCLMNVLLAVAVFMFMHIELAILWLIVERTIRFGILIISVASAFGIKKLVCCKSQQGVKIK